MKKKSYLLLLLLILNFSVINKCQANRLNNTLKKIITPFKKQAKFLANLDQPSLKAISNIFRKYNKDENGNFLDIDDNKILYTREFERQCTVLKVSVVNKDTPIDILVNFDPKKITLEAFRKLSKKDQIDYLNNKCKKEAEDYSICDIVKEIHLDEKEYIKKIFHLNKNSIIILATIELSVIGLIISYIIKKLINKKYINFTIEELNNSNFDTEIENDNKLKALKIRLSSTTSHEQKERIIKEIAQDLSSKKNIFSKLHTLIAG